MSQRVATVAAIAIAATVGLALPAAGDSAASKEFKKKFEGTQNSWERRRFIEQLDPTDDDSLELITDFVLKTQDWYMREGAIQVLAGAYDPGLIQKLERLCGGRGDAVIVEGVCMAFGRSGNRDRVPFLIEQLDSKKWVVKRAAAIALGMIPDKRSVPALITAWEGEEKFMVWVHILESLEKITRQKNMPRPADWRGWWEAVKDTWEVPTESADNLDEEEMKSGDRVQTRVRGTNLDSRLRGNGLPLLVLPDYGYENDYLQTYLRNLEDTNRIIYMKLPGVQDFSEPALTNAPGLPAPWYPIDRLVESFEELHKELVSASPPKIEDKPFAIMAHGLTCWIAMKYAATHPQRVRRLILVAPTSGNKAWGDGRDRLERNGQQIRDLELEHYAQSLVYNQQTGKHNYEAAGDDDSAALQRKSWTCRFFDFRDLEIGRIYGPIVEKHVGENQVGMAPKVFRPMGSVFIPDDFSLFRLDRVQTPTICIMGARSVWTSEEDGNAIARHYGQAGRLVMFPNSCEMPFIEENEKFVEIVQRFLGSNRR
jgi:pimeloyl-ACP methyl ester carboxylesterase